MSSSLQRAVLSVAIALGLMGNPASLCASTYKVERVATELDQPVQVAQAPGDTSSIYVLEGQTNDFADGNGSGQILKVDLATGAKSSFLRVQDIHRPREGGLHAMTFHPNFESNGKFYLSWMKNPNEGNTRPQIRLDEYQVQDNIPVATRTLIDITHLNFAPWHGIDWIGFKPGATGAEKDYLYITTGDGGIQADVPTYAAPAQDLSSVLGKVLRIDLAGADAYPADATRNYGIPTGNPYAEDSNEATLGEIYHSGLRNPWRASFDRLTGDFYIGDVGFNTSEEINFAKAGQSGLDFGWSSREGTQEAPVPGVGGPQGDSLNPIFELLHDSDQGIENIGAITGGIVYRGPIVELQGQYLFAEARAGEILTGTYDRTIDSANFDGKNLANFTIRTDELNALIEGEGEINVVVSFDEDAAGNVYLSDFSDGSFNNQFNVGEIYRLVPDLSADFNDDGFIDAADLAKWSTDVGLGPGSDADNDGDSDGADFLAWQRSVGSVSAGAGFLLAAPEPMTSALLATGLAIIAAGRRRTKLTTTAEH